MKLTGKMALTVLSKEVRHSDSTGKDSYNLAVLQGSEAGSITCTEDVFNGIKPLHTYDFYGTYDDKYNYMKITSVDVKSEKPFGSVK